jgi:hypothetical protein
LRFGFVAAGVGVGFMARSNVVEDVRAGILVAIALADDSIRREPALVFKDKALSRAALEFIDIAVKYEDRPRSGAEFSGNRQPGAERPGPSDRLARSSFLKNLLEFPGAARLRVLFF